MSNVIPAVFDPAIFNQIFDRIKYQGIKRTEKQLIDSGLHPSFVKAAMRRLIRERGW